MLNLSDDVFSLFVYLFVLFVFCRLVIFVVPANTSSSQPVKLERDEPLKIFDFRNFVDQFIKYQNSEITMAPSAEVLIGFGQDWKSETNPSNNLLISASVFHSQAFLCLAQVCFILLFVCVCVC